MQPKYSSKYRSWPTWSFRPKKLILKIPKTEIMKVLVVCDEWWFRSEIYEFNKKK